MPSPPIQVVDGLCAVLLRDHIDTDTVIPSRDIRSPTGEGLGARLFAPWRFAADGSEQPDFVLNQPAYRQATVLLAGQNFGCGSSREMAVWALAQFGFRCIVAGSFGGIFRQNAVRNGLLPVALPADALQALAAHCQATPTRLRIDLQACTVSLADDGSVAPLPFTFDADDRELLLTGMDAIDRTWQYRAAIEGFEAADRLRRPWAWTVAETPTPGSPASP
jgi:3-isopropylmalate/(R)-2-methylmalate dehydratase small subunit